MTAGDRCERTELLVGDCAHCGGHQSLVDTAEQETLALRTKLLASPRWFPAQYPGTCVGCGERFAAGAAIQGKHPVNSGRWIAECCAEEPP